MSVFNLFLQVTDKRNNRGKRYSLASLLSVVLLSKLLGFQGHRAASRLAHQLNASQKRRLGFRDPSKSPVHETFNNALQQVCPDQLEQVFSSYIGSNLADIAPSSEEECSYIPVGIDGKTLRGSKDKEHGVQHIVSLFCDRVKGVLGQVSSNVGAGEIEAAIELLSNQDLKGLLVTGDAAFTQTTVCETIIEQEGHFLLPVKGNQPRLLSDIKLAFEECNEEEIRTAEQPIDKKHGRIEQRSIEVIDMPWEYNNAWRHVAQIARLTRYRSDRKGDHKTIAYLITSLDKKHISAKEVLDINRGHWTVETNHYVRDVVLGEDRSTIKTKAAPQMNAAINNLAVHLLSKVDASPTRAIQKIVMKQKIAMQLIVANF